MENDACGGLHFETWVSLIGDKEWSACEGLLNALYQKMTIDLNGVSHW